MSEPFRRFLSKLSAHGSMLTMQHGGKSALAHCPYHEDNKQSLSVKIGKDDRVLVHCFAGCETEDILAALGMEMADLFGEPAPKQQAQEVKIVATYDYRDEKGELLNQVVRLEPKSFRQRRPDGQGGWNWTLGDVRRVLYRLPEMSKDRKQPLWIVEGEKDADALAALGFRVTTTLGGASAWRTEYVDSMVRCQVKGAYIVPDNDAPGRKYAYAIAKDIHAARIPVKIVNLPGVPEKGDVSDWLKTAQYPAGDLRRLAQAAPLFTGQEAPPGLDPIEAASNDGLVVRGMNKVNARPTNWLWEDRIPRGELTLIVGDPSAGKTFVTQAISTAAADGKEWPLGLCGRAIEGAVVYVTVEDNPETSMKPRMLAMGLRNEANILLVEGFRERGKQRTVSIIDDLPAIELLCSKSAAVMLVISPINSYLNTSRKKALSGYKDEDVREVLTPLVQLAQRLDLAVIGVMHMNKSEQTSIMYRIGGSIAFAAVPRVVYCVLRDNENRNKRYFGSLKANDMPDPKTLEFHIESTPGVKSGHVAWDGESEKSVYELMAEAQQKKSKAKQSKEARRASIVEWLTDHLSQGPQRSISVYQAGWGDGFKYTEREIDRVARDIGVEKRRSGPNPADPWVWELKA